jgi:hypothetical protein
MKGNLLLLITIRVIIIIVTTITMITIITNVFIVVSHRAENGIDIRFSRISIHQLEMKL